MLGPRGERPEGATTSAAFDWMSNVPAQRRQKWSRGKRGCHNGLNGSDAGVCAQVGVVRRLDWRDTRLLCLSRHDPQGEAAMAMGGRHRGAVAGGDWVSGLAICDPAVPQGPSGCRRLASVPVGPSPPGSPISLPPDKRCRIMPPPAAPRLDSESLLEMESPAPASGCTPT